MKTATHWAERWKMGDFPVDPDLVWYVYTIQHDALNAAAGVFRSRADNADSLIEEVIYAAVANEVLALLPQPTAPQSDQRDGGV